VIVTFVPPAGGPVFGVTPEMVGVNSNVSVAEMGLVPFAVVTVTSTFPTVSDGETAVIEVAEFTAKLVALVEPNLTVRTFLKFVPTIVTDVPPDAGPLLGVTLVTVGLGGPEAYAGTALPASAPTASTASHAATSESARLPLRSATVACSRVKKPLCDRPLGLVMFPPLTRVL
jgi:hypothetical protein